VTEQFNLTKEEKKKLADHLYKEEEDRWANVTKAYYQPEGAPGRLSEELLDQWHRQKDTGVRHPSDLRRTLVKVSYDERSFGIKNFLTSTGAKNYIAAVEHYGLTAEIVDEDTLTRFMGAF